MDDGGDDGDDIAQVLGIDNMVQMDCQRLEVADLYEVEKLDGHVLVEDAGVEKEDDGNGTVVIFVEDDYGWSAIEMDQMLLDFDRYVGFSAQLEYSTVGLTSVLADRERYDEYPRLDEVNCSSLACHPVALEHLLKFHNDAAVAEVVDEIVVLEYAGEGCAHLRSQAEAS